LVVETPVRDRRAYVVEDDAALRATMRRILTSAGIYAEEFGSAEALLEGYSGRPLGCVLLDVRLPGISGLDVLPLLAKQAPPNPVIIVSGHADIPLAVAAVRAGAVEVVEKPFRKERFLAAVEQAFGLISAARRSSPAQLESLTPRERQVLLAFADGEPSKVVAARLELSPRTVEMYRSGIIKKLGVANMTQAILQARECGYVG
jgi:two-component system response regulator FixJ